MKFERLGDLRPDPHRRVERGHRVLKHHRDVAPHGSVMLARGRPKHPLRPANLARHKLA